MGAGQQSLYPKKKEYIFRFIAAEFYHQGAVEEAVSWLEKIVEDSPQEREAMILLGKIYLNLGKLKEAADIWRRAWKIDQNDEELNQCLKGFGERGYSIPENK